MALYTDNKFVDIHSHIIYGVDDGAENIKESARMLGIAYGEGIVGIIATPHYGITNVGYNYKKVKEHQAILNNKLISNGINLRIYLGNEVYWNPGIIEELDNGKALTMAGTSYVLVEFGVYSEYYELSDAVHALVSAGYRPIIAHLERYQCLKNNIYRVNELINQGAYVQVNTGNFLKDRRDDRSKWAKTLLMEDLIHFIGTDAHNESRRPPIMKEAVKEMEKLASKKQILKIVRDNVVHLIRNEYV